jgi:hypothetical protein
LGFRTANRGPRRLDRQSRRDIVIDGVAILDRLKLQQVVRLTADRAPGNLCAAGNGADAAVIAGHSANPPRRLILRDPVVRIRSADAGEADGCHSIRIGHLRPMCGSICILGAA